MVSISNVLMPSSLRRAAGPVYHYTSSVGLLGLVESGCIWASEATSLNDLAEVRHGWDVVKAWLANQSRSDAVDLLLDMANDPLEQKHEVFVLSGSTAADDANQWRLYGQHGHGYAVELDPSVALAAISGSREWKPRKRSPAGTATNGFESLFSNVVTVSPWYHVLYEESDAEIALDELVVALEHELPSLRKAKSEEEYSELRDILYGKALEALGTIAHLLKGPGFAGEREVRIVTTFLLADRHIKYRPGPHGVVSYGLLTRSPKKHVAYRVLHWSNKRKRGKRPGKPLPIRSVRLGPLLNEEHVHTVKRLLENNSLRSADVAPSTVRLR